jgi:very-short-patch-repair endonuclease
MSRLFRIKPKNKQRSRTLRKEMTIAERLLWKALRNKQLNQYKFRRQHPYGKYILDFVCLEAKLVIEVDGGQHQENTMYDQNRSMWLERQGFKVLRFWNNEVLNNLDAVMQVIWHELHLDIQPPSQPSPCQGEGE